MTRQQRISAARIALSKIRALLEPFAAAQGRSTALKEVEREMSEFLDKLERNGQEENSEA